MKGDKGESVLVHCAKIKTNTKLCIVITDGFEIIAENQGAASRFITGNAEWKVYLCCPRQLLLLQQPLE